MEAPYYLSPKIAAEFLERELVFYARGEHYAHLFGDTLRLTDGQRHCFDPLWQNFFAGNLPLPQARLIRSWYGRCRYVSDLCKRNEIWRRYVVSDGKGGLSIYVPEHFRVASPAELDAVLKR